MKSCNKCEWQGEPVLELQPGGKTVSQCPQCSSVITEAPQPTAPVASILADPRGLRKQPVAQANILELAQQRLQEIESQLADMDRLKREAKQLKRMIKAADGSGAKV